jgi:hypothetical protein
MKIEKQNEIKEKTEIFERIERGMCAFCYYSFRSMETFEGNRKRFVYFRLGSFRSLICIHGWMCTDFFRSLRKTHLQVLEDMVEGERKAWEDRAMSVAKRHEQLERDHQSLKEELENTRSLMQKAGLGIRLSLDSVRELSDGDVVELLNPKPLSSSRPKP